MKGRRGAWEVLEFPYGGATIRCDVERAAARRLCITVFPDKRIYVSAPRGVSMAQIQERVQRRAPWILRQLDRFERFQPVQPPRRYVGGETHLFLGRQYRLRIEPASRFYVSLQGRYLVAHSRTPKDALHIRRMVDRWYLRQARQILPARFRECAARIRPARFIPNKLRLYRMKNRWGSCTRGGTITLNRDLVKAPASCIDYEIVHELCHLGEHNHGRAFYNLLRRWMPDWERRKARLDSAMASAV